MGIVVPMGMLVQVLVLLTRLGRHRQTEPKAEMSMRAAVRVAVLEASMAMTPDLGRAHDSLSLLRASA
jgi:hypothetical protein